MEEFGGVSWFNSALVRCVGNGRKTSFWKDAWRGGMPFRDKYPRLFSTSNQKGESVGDMVGEPSPNVVWNFEWRRRLFVWEEHLLDDLREELVEFRPFEEEGGGGGG